MVWANWPAWHRNCMLSFFSLTFHTQAVPSKLPVNNHRPDFENRVQNMGPFSNRGTESQLGGHLRSSQCELCMSDTLHTWCCGWIIYCSPVTVQTRNIASYDPVASNVPSLFQSNEVISRCSDFGWCFSTIASVFGSWANSVGSSGGSGKVHIRAVASLDLFW